MSRRHTLQLASGLRIVLTECPHLHSVAISAAVRCGSRHEDARSWGLTHLVEHMLFRGSVSYPSPPLLVAPFEQAGGTLAAETWRDHTHFSTTVHPSGAHAALRALGDALARPLWQDLEAERALVQAELAADLDGDDAEAGDADLTNVSRAAVWRNHPMGRRITGSPARVAAFSEADVTRHHGRHYHAGNVVVSLAGPLDAATWLPRIAEAFRFLRCAPAANDPKAKPTTAPKFAPRARLTSRDVASNQVALQISYATVADAHPDFVAMQMLAAVLDDGMGTRLHRALSERTGLVYAFHSGLDCYHDAGIYELEMQLAPSRTAAALACALTSFAEIAQRGVQPKELQDAQQRATMAWEIGADAVDELAYDAALDLLFDRPCADQLAARRALLQPQDLTRLARATFLTGQRHVTMMGPLQQVDRLAVARLLRTPALSKAAPAPRGRLRRATVQVAAGSRRKR